MPTVTQGNLLPAFIVRDEEGKEIGLEELFSRIKKFGILVLYWNDMSKKALTNPSLFEFHHFQEKELCIFGYSMENRHQPYWEQVFLAQLNQIQMATPGRLFSVAKKLCSLLHERNARLERINRKLGALLV